MTKCKVLLLAGTSEAAEIARWLAANEAVEAVASLAGETRAPRDLGLPMRNGGFGGSEAFAKYLADNHIDIVVDATHPFATRITRRTARICSEKGVKYLLVQRPGWQAERGDKWHEVADVEAVKGLIPDGSTVFLATGRTTLPQFAGMKDCRILCRVIDPPRSEFPLENGRFVVGKPPFSVEEEVELFRTEGVDWIVVKNSGGEQSKSKLIAARQLGLPVAMIAREPVPRGCPVMRSAEEACEWLARESGNWT
jgi:precorrin-6A/cobalt-precorrin-6A reductase